MDKFNEIFDGMLNKRLPNINPLEAESKRLVVHLLNTAVYRITETNDLNEQVKQINNILFTTLHAFNKMGIFPLNFYNNIFAYSQDTISGNHQHQYDEFINLVEQELNRQTIPTTNGVHIGDVGQGDELTKFVINFVRDGGYDIAFVDHHAFALVKENKFWLIRLIEKNDGEVMVYLHQKPEPIRFVDMRADEVLTSYMILFRFKRPFETKVDVHGLISQGYKNATALMRDMYQVIQEDIAAQKLKDKNTYYCTQCSLHTDKPIRANISAFSHFKCPVCGSRLFRLDVSGSDINMVKDDV